MVPTWGPPGSCQPQMGPMLAPLILLSGSFTCVFSSRLRHWNVFLFCAYSKRRPFFTEAVLQFLKPRRKVRRKVCLTNVLDLNHATNTKIYMRGTMYFECHRISSIPIIGQHWQIYHCRDLHIWLPFSRKSRLAKYERKYISCCDAQIQSVFSVAHAMRRIQYHWI